jgi:dTDP-4-dehydrorhamnose 3,5-epimerase
MITVSDGGLPGIRIIETRVYPDERGHFRELWRASDEELLGVGPFVQDNASWSTKGVIRGLHYQDPHPQAKLVCVLQGEVFDVAVDIRRDSATYGRWSGVRLRAGDGKQVFVPEGFAHGFAVLSEAALVFYKCTDYYRPEHARVIRWDDPVIGVEWPVEEVVVSEGDRAAGRFDEQTG